MGRAQDRAVREQDAFAARGRGVPRAGLLRRDRHLARSVVLEGQPGAALQDVEGRGVEQDVVLQQPGHRRRRVRRLRDPLGERLRHVLLQPGGDRLDLLRGVVRRRGAGRGPSMSGTSAGAAEAATGVAKTAAASASAVASAERRRAVVDMVVSSSSSWCGAHPVRASCGSVTSAVLAAASSGGACCALAVGSGRVPPRDARTVTTEPSTRSCVASRSGAPDRVPGGAVHDDGPVRADLPVAVLDDDRRVGRAGPLGPAGHDPGPVHRHVQQHRHRAPTGGDAVERDNTSTDAGGSARCPGTASNGLGAPTSLVPGTSCATTSTRWRSTRSPCAASSGADTGRAPRAAAAGPRPARAAPRRGPRPARRARPGPRRGRRSPAGRRRATRRGATAARARPATPAAGRPAHTRPLWTCRPGARNGRARAASSARGPRPGASPRGTGTPSGAATRPAR